MQKEFESLLKDSILKSLSESSIIGDMTLGISENFSNRCFSSRKTYKCGKFITALLKKP